MILITLSWDESNVMTSILNKPAPIKQKHIRANHVDFVTKELRKTIMKRTRLRNIFLKKNQKIRTLGTINQEIFVKSYKKG